MYARRIRFGSNSAKRLKRSRHDSGSRRPSTTLVSEKLMSFASAAFRHPDFARELPQFVSEVRRMFTPDEIGAQLAQIERSQNERNVDVLEEDDLLREGPAAVAECVQQFTLVKELLTAPMLGTSCQNDELLLDVARGSPPKSRTFPVGS